MFDQYWTSESSVSPELEEHYQKIAARLRRKESVSLADIHIHGGSGWMIWRLTQEFPDAKVKMAPPKVKLHKKEQ